MLQKVKNAYDGESLPFSSSIPLTLPHKETNRFQTSTQCFAKLASESRSVKNCIL